jgi:hypothetical protein
MTGCPAPHGDDSAARGDSEAPLPAYEGPNVVLVLIDGVRYSEGLGDPEASWTPELHALAAQGCAPGPMLNQGTTTTKYGTASIHTGVWNAWVAESNQHPAHYSQPTHWEYLRASHDLPPERVIYALPGYSDGSVWKPSYDEDFGPDVWPLILNEGWSDAAVVEAFLGAVDEHEPVFSMVYLPDVDSAGHAGLWEDYTATVAEADRLVGLLWDALQERPTYAGNTVLMVTSDHGRHDDAHGGFTHHGCDCDGCREVGFLAVGPGVDPACAPSEPWELVDIVPTLGALQGWVPATTDGEVMEAMLLEEEPG